MSDLANVYLTAFGLVLLGVLFHFGINPYRLDLLRHRLFLLRNELFMFAAEGGISFDDPAYCMLRSRINAIIRYAHTFTLARVLVMVTDKASEQNPAFLRMQQDSGYALAHLPTHARTKIDAISTQVSTTLAWHIVNDIPLIFVLSRLSGLLHIRAGLKQHAVKTVPVDMIEDEAVLALKQEAELVHA
jgi:hypothetical protein